MSNKLENAPRIQTEIVVYQLNLDMEHEAEEYAALKQKMEEKGIRLMRVYPSGGRSRPLKSGPVTIETDFLFADQSNTTDDSETNPSCRIHDWYEEIVPNKDVRRGHYTVITEELAKLREDVVICGYCGNREWKETAGAFCTSCLGSPHLGEDHLKLTIFHPISEDRTSAKKSLDDLPPETRNELQSAYLSAQTQRQEADAEKEIAKVKADYEKNEKRLRTERDGFLWLLEKGIPTDNCIFYSHKETFSFGWRNGLTDTVKSALTTKLEDFPFQYEFK
jgi:hypothetical protein